MRHPRLSSTHLVAAALAIAGVLAPMPVFAQAQPPAQAPAQQPAPVLGPYKPVRITLPPGVNDPSFDTFRKQLTEIANNKDRAALARLVAANFFWVPEDKDIADKQKSGIDNLAKALSLDGTDAFGWEALAAYARQRQEYPKAIEYLRLAVARDPLRESAQRALMEVLAARGNSAEALHVYEELRTLLREELGAAPSPETQRVHRALLG